MSITGVKVVIDTNVFITIFKKDSKNRWMLDKKTNAQVAANIINFLVSHPFIQFVENYIRLNLIDSDPDDNKFCDCCFSSSSSYLISNDTHFNILKQTEFPSLPLVTSDEVRKIFFNET